MMTPASYQILLVEDNPDDVWMIQRAFRDSKLPCQIHVCEDGEQATLFLQQRAHHMSAPRPDLILLDLGLPKKGGGQVLSEIKADARLKHIPVVILTGSDSEEDILRSYANYANSYVQKPSLEPFGKKIRNIVDYWLTTARLPKDGRQEAQVGFSEDGRSNGRSDLS
jgi:two-component system, chemotaxis family, response regulator Rcp1